MRMPWLAVFLILISLSSCSKLKDSFSPQKGLIVTPAGNIFRTKEAWQQNVKDYNPKYRALHARAIVSTQDWKNYILDIFPEAQENPPSTIKPFPWPTNPSVFALYGDFLKTEKPTAVFMETMPGLPTVRTLIVSQWDNDRWNELLRLDENGIKTPYVALGLYSFYRESAAKKFQGYSIQADRHLWRDEYLNMRPSACNLNTSGCPTLDYVSWDPDGHRYCFSDPMGPGQSTGEFRDICDQKDLNEELKKQEKFRKEQK